MVKGSCRSAQWVEYTSVGVTKGSLLCGRSRVQSHACVRFPSPSIGPPNSKWVPDEKLGRNDAAREDWAAHNAMALGGTYLARRFPMLVSIMGLDPTFFIGKIAINRLKRII